MNTKLSDSDEWALQQSEIRNVMLVGQLEAAETPNDALASKRQSGYDRLLVGAQSTNARTRDAQQEFASQVDQISQIPVIHARWSDQALTVYGLFYRCQDGISLICEPGSDAFQPLVN